MNHLRIRTTLMLVLVGFSVLALSGCNTIRGVGQDVEKVGEEVQDASDATKS